MPKPFTPTERETIRRQLHEEGLKAFAANGLRAARISDIAAAAGIAKGSFYAFFASKEELLMEIAAARDVKHRAEMVAFLCDATGRPNAVLSGFFDDLMTRIETDPLLEILRDPGETNLLMRKISPEQFAQKARRDGTFLTEVATLLNRRHGVVHATPAVLESTMTLMVCLAMQAPFIDTPAYGASARVLREMFIARLVQGCSHD